MRCDEVQPLHDPYLDSELDARTALEIEQHLKSCPECRRLFAEAERANARLRASLNRGQRTAKLWDQIERSVAASPPAACATPPLPRRSQPMAWPGLLSVLGEELQVGWRRVRWAWSGLAAAWVVILVLNLAAREAEPPLVAAKRLPPASEVRSAVRQKQLLMAELAFISESTPANKSKTALPGPRSDRRHEPVNT